MDKETAEKLEFNKCKIALAHQREFDCVGDKPLGNGAFGYVVKAKCRKEGKTYAIKLLPMREGERFKYQERELKALTKLKFSEESKRNVIEYFNAWVLQVDDRQKFCIQMELCSVDLETFVFKNRIFGPQEVIQTQSSPRFYQQVFQQILNGLVFIHSIGWVHRDIHPGNILIVNSNPQQISDIHVKIADFGLARNIRDMGIEFKLSAGWTIHPEFEQSTPYAGNGLYTAPELLTTTYDYKVDLYSAGIVLYFISCYPKENEKEWITELTGIIQDKLDINKRSFYQDDKKLGSLIKDLLRKNPHKRPSARDAKERMFPEDKDSTDSKEPQKIKFFARKENEQDIRLCFLNEFTFAALRAEVESRTHVKAGRQVLRQEDMINGKTMRIIIENDKDVENIFEDVAQKAQNDRYVVVVVIEKAEDDTNIKTGQISSGDTIMKSV